MVTFHIVRHGETLLNSLGKAQGWCDSPLTQNGVSSALELGASLRDTSFDGLYCSDTIRAVETATEILRSLGDDGIKVRQDARLREWCLGDLEAQDNAAFVETVSRWMGGIASFGELNERLGEVAESIFEHDTTGMAEPFSKITERLDDVFCEIANSIKPRFDANILVVTHAFVIKTLFHMYSPEKLHTETKIGNASVYRLIAESGQLYFE